MCDEIWKAIEGFEHYQISNKARVKSVLTGKILKDSDNGNGYRRLNLCKNGIRYKHFIHRLVAAHFVSGRTEEKSDVHHKNSDKSFNLPENLEWVTPKENVDYYYQSEPHRKHKHKKIIFEDSEEKNVN